MKIMKCENNLYYGIRIIVDKFLKFLKYFVNLGELIFIKIDKSIVYMY